MEVQHTVFMLLHHVTGDWGYGDIQEWGGEPNMRLGLKMHQRVSVQQHVKLLQQQLDTAAGDLQVNAGMMLLPASVLPRDIAKDNERVHEGPLVRSFALSCQAIHSDFVVLSFECIC